ncbi:YihA family ribosome biogenesis GTP-binding protein [Candidatus Parcubacteria bacterium]|nr:YihA family ribosome biogenesis GTP-binding protein [Candidatus Parcubacteria bacterium]
MNVKSAEFVKGIVGPDQMLEDGKHKIAFIGRSNVGKSSVINSLLGKKGLVKSSSTPGKTKEINLFLVNEIMYFVDLPGYGYAKISMQAREKLRNLILWYLTSPEIEHSRIVLIIDAKVGPTKLDEEMVEILKNHGHDFMVIANKADKLKRNSRIVQLKTIQKKIGAEVILYSSKTRDGKKEVFAKIFE